MVQVSEKLSMNIPFVHIDFYEINYKPFFGEIAFYPASGFGSFAPNYWNLNLGNKLELYEH